MALQPFKIKRTEDLPTAARLNLPANYTPPPVSRQAPPMASNSLGHTAESITNAVGGGLWRSAINLAKFGTQVQTSVPVFPAYWANKISGGNLQTHATNTLNDVQSQIAPEPGTRTNSLAPTHPSNYNPTMQRARVAGSVVKAGIEQAALLAASGGMGNLAEGAIGGTSIASQVGRNALGGFASGATFGAGSAALQGASPKEAAIQGAKWGAAGAIGGAVVPAVPNVGNTPYLRAVPRAVTGAVVGGATAPLAGMTPAQGAAFGLLGGTQKPYERGSIKIKPVPENTPATPKPVEGPVNIRDNPEAAMKAYYADVQAAEATSAKGKRQIAPSIENKKSANSNLVNKATSDMTPEEFNRYMTTAKNPQVRDIPELQPGDYQGVPFNTQAASKPLQVHEAVVQNALTRLTQDERNNFWNMVANPSLATSPEAKHAIETWRNMADYTHATSTALGGKAGYARNYDLRHFDMTDQNTIDAVMALAGGKKVNPNDFAGLDAISRKFKTRAELVNWMNKNREKLKTENKPFQFANPGNPAADISFYAQTRGGTLRNQALAKAISEADSTNFQKTRSIDMGNGNVIPISQEGYDAVKGIIPYKPSQNKFVKGYREVNRQAKGSLLSASQFHTINIAGLRAAPTLLAEGHPIRAIEGAYRTIRGAFGADYAPEVLNKAAKDGMVNKAAQIGMPYGSTDYTIGGEMGHFGSAIGEKTVFGKQMPMMHDQVARSVIHDLEKKGIPLNSPEARAAGLEANKLMGFINVEAQNLSPQVQRGLGDLFFAPQFFRSGIEILGDSATKGGVAGSYARRAVAANIAATTAVALGIGYVVGQKTDNVKDLLLRALIDPSVPTPWKDSKGNTVELRMPASLTATPAKLLGLKLVRNPDGHLGVSWDMKAWVKTVGDGNPLTDFMRSRLAVIPATITKAITNTSYSGKPLYDSNAPAGTQAIQAGTTLTTGLLPIGAQGLPYTEQVQKFLPQTSVDVLKATSPGTNPLVKSLSSSVGLTPRTSKLTGEGLQNDQYFGALDNAKQKLNAQETRAIEQYSGSKKNPVTGKYEVMPTVYDQKARADLLLQNPRVIDRLIGMNQELQTKGQKVDPLWNLPKDQITKYLQYQTMAPNGPDQKVWRSNNPWYRDVQTQRSAFFDSLPPADPNKPKAPIEYPQASDQVQRLQDTYFSLTDPTQKAQFLRNNSALQDQFDNQTKYYNDIRTAQGLQAFKDYPKATPQMQQFIDTYSGADKATKKGLRNSNPQQYQNMIAYFDSVDLFGIGNQAAQSQLQGQPDYTSKELKQMSGLSRDIYQNADGTYSVVPAGWMQGLKNGSSSSYSKSSSSKSYKPYSKNIYIKSAPKLKAKSAAPKITIKKGRQAAIKRIK